MSQLHICNSFFEGELELGAKKPLVNWVRSNPIYLQLQFLPLLYSNPEDLILVSDLPEGADSRLKTMDSTLPKGSLSSWGPSLAIQAWAKTKNFSYEIPHWDLVEKINSKAFSFQETPKLPFAELFKDEKEIEKWVEKTPGPKVLKSVFGTSGKGHFHLGQKGNLSKFLHSQFSLSLPIIGEPWVERLFDFSSQWVIEAADIHFLGFTSFSNTSLGTYLSTTLGKNFSPFEWALEEHLVFAKPLMQKIHELGYFGHVGLDAFVYKWEGKEKVHPIVEINGRKTMSWAALEIHKKRFAGKTLHFSYCTAKEGVLPNRLNIGGKSIEFKRNLILTVT